MAGKDTEVHPKGKETIFLALGTRSSAVDHDLSSVCPAGHFLFLKLFTNIPNYLRISSSFFALHSLSRAAVSLTSLHMWVHATTWEMGVQRADMIEELRWGQT